MLNHYDWQPGNGTRYDLYYSRKGDRGFISWMRRGGAGGTAMTFTHYLHYSYIMEKMEINIADAVGILKFLEEMGHDVGYPDPDRLFEGANGKAQIKILE